MLEGEFVARRMLDPAAVGKALWWGTSGERVRQQNDLGALVLDFTRTSGVVIWGEDVRLEIPEVSEWELLDSLREDCRNMKEHGQGGGLHAVEWLFTAARGLLWLSERSLASKSEAADWAFAHARGEWRELLPRAKQIRLNPGMIEKAEVRSWLAELTPAIQQARAELDMTLPPG